MEANKPQQFLDELHAIGISGLYDLSLSPLDRKAAVKLAKQKLKLVKKNLGQDMKTIKAEYDGRVHIEAIMEQEELAPYIPLENLLDRLEIALSELETTDTPGDAPQIGKYITQHYGDVGDWEIVGTEVFLERKTDVLRRQINGVREVIEKAEQALRKRYWKRNGTIETLLT